MPGTITRRTALTGAAAMALAFRSYALAAEKPKASDTENTQAHLRAIETGIGGRLGVAVLDTGSGARMMHRADELFPLASTFKFLAAAAALHKVDDGGARLDQIVRYSQADVLSYAPVTSAHVADGMTLADLCAAAVEVSDNTAGNLLLREIGGPAGLTQYMRSLGDGKTRLDRTEPTLNTAIPGDPRDTTTPAAMVADMQAILLGTALVAASRQNLETWLANCKTGGKRLRAGLPASWLVGDKTGGGDNNTANTIAILRPPGRAPILAAVYCTGSKAAAKDIDAAHAEVARLIAETI